MLQVKAGFQTWNRLHYRLIRIHIFISLIVCKGLQESENLSSDFVVIGQSFVIPSSSDISSEDVSNPLSPNSSHANYKLPGWDAHGYNIPVTRTHQYSTSWTGNIVGCSLKNEKVQLGVEVGVKFRFTCDFLNLKKPFCALTKETQILYIRIRCVEC